MGLPGIVGAGEKDNSSGVSLPLQRGDDSLKDAVVCSGRNPLGCGDTDVAVGRLSVEYLDPGFTVRAL